LIPLLLGRPSKFRLKDSVNAVPCNHAWRGIDEA
jgi:hypothetical protein